MQYVLCAITNYLMTWRRVYIFQSKKASSFISCYEICVVCPYKEVRALRGKNAPPPFLAKN